MTAIAERATETAAAAEVSPVSGDALTVALPRPRLEMLNPAMLTIATNVRKELDMTPEFLDSVKQHGVLVPIVAQITDEGEIHVLYGQRRTIAALEGGLGQVPVYVSEAQAEADRIAKQVVENDQRSGLSEGDRAAAFEQLALLGVSATQIAKRTGAKKNDVEDAIKARSTTTGTKALHDGHTVMEALVLAEFEGNEDAVAELESVIKDEPEYLDHVAQKLRDDRDSQRALDTLIAELTAQGTVVVEDADGYYGDTENMHVSRLNRADGEPATDEDANAVTIETNYRREHKAVPVVKGWKELGFTPKFERHYSTTQAQSGPMTEDQKEERRTLIANNKAALSAEVVRREFVKTLLSRKTGPKGWQYFTVHAITHHPEVATGYEGKTAADMAGVKTDESGTWGWNPLRDHVAGTKNRPEVSLIALVCAGYEKQLPKDAWRRPSQAQKDYLNQLVAWGYTASETEKLIIDAN
ncbi:ParB/RepB/Spo0J family partition protein [Paenarthrobacter histidinolovorans]|uniref:ParB family chromosome partitioning protein n=1 Tax=Paenarthrobacter histidinolovorans TaxID=43664 RepID=A0ABW8N397_9MICC